MQSRATTVEAYLAELPADRRAAIEAVRAVILRNLDKDYREGMQYGMIGYCVPHSVFPDGYHCDPKQPLPFAALASQKQHMSLYLMGLYCGCADGESENGHARWFREAWAKTGKKLDMGKACIRFKKVEDLALEVIGEAIRRVPAAEYIRVYRETVPPKKGSATKGVGKKAAAGEAVAKSSAGPKQTAAKRAGSAKAGAKAGPKVAAKRR